MAMVTCPACEGTGRFAEDDHVETCKNCKGTGKVDDGEGESSFDAEPAADT